MPVLVNQALSLHDALPILSFPRPMKLSAAALALVTPFALVACGSDESEETAAPSTSAVTSTVRSEEHTSELQSRFDIVCRLLLETKKKIASGNHIIAQAN